MNRIKSYVKKIINHIKINHNYVIMIENYHNTFVFHVLLTNLEHFQSKYSSYYLMSLM